MKKAVLFDFDGTLINTNELIFESYRVAFRTVLNREIKMDEILGLYGRPLYPSLMEYGEVGERLCDVYREFNKNHHDEMALPFNGAYEGVMMLKEKGYSLGIVTSKRHHMVEKGIKILKMEGLFDVIITPEDTEKSKPDPEPVLCGCKRLGVNPQNTIYVGDSVFDMESGQRAGTRLCAVKYSITPAEQLLTFSPDFFVDIIKEFAEKVEDVS